MCLSVKNFAKKICPYEPCTKLTDFQFSTSNCLQTNNEKFTIVPYYRTLVRVRAVSDNERIRHVYVALAETFYISYESPVRKRSLVCTFRRTDPQ